MFCLPQSSLALACSWCSLCLAPGCRPSGSEQDDTTEPCYCLWTQPHLVYKRSCQSQLAWWNNLFVTAGNVPVIMLTDAIYLVKISWYQWILSWSYCQNTKNPKPCPAFHHFNFHSNVREALEQGYQDTVSCFFMTETTPNFSMQLVFINASLRTCQLTKSCQPSWWWCINWQ